MPPLTSRPIRKAILNALLASINARASLHERLNQPVRWSGGLATGVGLVSRLEPALNLDYLSLSTPRFEMARSGGRAEVEPKPPAETKAADSPTFVQV